MSKARVLIPGSLTPSAEQLLQDSDFELVRIKSTTKDDFMQEIQGCDAVVVKKAGGYIWDKELIDVAKDIKVLARFGVGMEIIDVDYAQERGIVVTNSPTANSNAVAEHTMYLMLACAKNARILQNRVYSGKFNAPPAQNGLELEGLTLGVIGCGRIGSMVAHKAKHGFDMKVIGFDKYIPAEKFSEDIQRKNSIEEVFKEADIISLHMAATKETIGSIDAKYFEIMKPTAIIINAARGEIIKEADLVEALRNHTIACAGLDVFEHEPLSTDSPLMTLDNVILTPHYAAFTSGATEKTAMDVARDIVAVLNKQVPAHEVTHLKYSPKL